MLRDFGPWARMQLHRIHWPSGCMYLMRVRRNCLRQRELQLMKSMKARLANPASVLLWLVAFSCDNLVASAQNVQHLSTPQPGGMPGAGNDGYRGQCHQRHRPTCHGPAGYYQLFQRQPGSSSWQAVGKATNLCEESHAALAL